MIDNESRFPAQALWPQPGLVTVSGQDEQVGVGRRVHHLPLRAPVAADPLAGAAKSLGGGVEQLGR
jgi:hypothetical protein